RDVRLARRGQRRFCLRHCLLTVRRVGFLFSSRRRHTRSKRDWSSDVCSSDLRIRGAPRRVSPLIRALPLPPSTPATFPARRPLRRLDSIWLLGALRGGELDVARTRASDHRPVVATIHRLGGEDAAPTG